MIDFLKDAWRDIKYEESTSDRGIRFLILVILMPIFLAIAIPTVALICIGHGIGYLVGLLIPYTDPCKEDLPL